MQNIINLDSDSQTLPAIKTNEYMLGKQSLQLKSPPQEELPQQSDPQYTLKYLLQNPTPMKLISTIKTRISNLSVYKYRESHQRIFIYTMLGHSFIEGYKLFKVWKPKEPQMKDKPLYKEQLQSELNSKQSRFPQIVILSKQSGKSSIYFYMAFVGSITASSLLTPTLTSLTNSISSINTFRGDQQSTFKTSICEFENQSYLSLTKMQFIQLLNGELDVSNNLCKISLEQKQVQQQKDKDIVVYRRQEFQSLKTIINNYIDTFGTKHKGNVYGEMEKYSPPEMKVQIILNTIAYTLYRESINKPYTQIESASWTTFNRRKYDKNSNHNTNISSGHLKIDRKDIVLSGKGRMLMLDFVFLQDLEQYLKKNNEQYMSQVKEVIDESRKFYEEIVIKTIKITNHLHQSRIVYETEIVEVQKFSEVTEIQDLIESIRKKRKL